MYLCGGRSSYLPIVDVALHFTVNRHLAMDLLPILDVMQKALR